MGNLGRALLGGIAGAAGAAGEVFDDRIEAKETDRKAAFLTKREEVLATFKQKLLLERDKSQSVQKGKDRD